MVPDIGDDTGMTRYGDEYKLTMSARIGMIDKPPYTAIVFGSSRNGRIPRCAGESTVIVGLTVYPQPGPIRYAYT